VLSPTVQKREEKLYTKRKSVTDSVLLRLVQQFLSLRTARHFPLSLPTEKSGCKHQQGVIFSI